MQCTYQFEFAINMQQTEQFGSSYWHSVFNTIRRYQMIGREFSDLPPVSDGCCSSVFCHRCQSSVIFCHYRDSCAQFNIFCLCQMVVTVQRSSAGVISMSLVQQSSAAIMIWLFQICEKQNKSITSYIKQFLLCKITIMRQCYPVKSISPRQVHTTTKSLSKGFKTRASKTSDLKVGGQMLFESVI